MKDAADAIGSGLDSTEKLRAAIEHAEPITAPPHSEDSENCGTRDHDSDDPEDNKVVPHSEDSENCGARGDGWEAPVPFGDFDLPAFPMNTLPPWLQSFVEAEAIATQTPADLPAMLALATIATACAKKAIVKVREGWVEPLNVYIVIALDPGNRKSAVFRDLAAPIEKYEQEEAIAAEPEIIKAENHFKILKGALDRAQGDAAKTKGSNRDRLTKDAEALAIELQSLCIPVRPRFVVDDCSPERLATLLSQHAGRMAVLSAEGDVFNLMAGRYAKDGAPNFAVFLKGHAGDTVRVDRVGRPPEFVAFPAVTIGLTVQVDVIRSLVMKPGFRGLGLLARFLYSIPKSLLGRRAPNPPPVPDSVRAVYQTYVSRLMAIPVVPDGNEEQSVPIIQLDEAAHRAVIAHQERIEPMLAPLGEMASMTDWGGKLVGAVVRIAGLLHIADHVESLTPWDTAISPETMEKAVQIGNYLTAHAQAAFAEMGADPAVQTARYVLAWIRKNDEPTFSKRDAFQAMKGRLRRVEIPEAALAVLVEHGYVRERTTTSPRRPGRKPSPIFEVNPGTWGHNSHIPHNAEPPTDPEDCEDSEDGDLESEGDHPTGTQTTAGDPIPSTPDTTSPSSIPSAVAEPDTTQPTDERDRGAQGATTTSEASDPIGSSPQQPIDDVDTEVIEL
ncbi:MAG: DUF3987 domain-containing protein [Planctomycetes bacterium]|nr:DUF3987 domain-containing protein [Planctomycetota bacterium]